MRDWTSLLKIDRQNKIPLYHQIVQNITELVEAGQLVAGDPLPSEPEMVQLFNVSRLTLRQALDILVRDGLVVRRHGVGTFIAQVGGTSIIPSKLSFSEKMRQIGKKPGSRVVSLNVVPASNETASRLQIPPETPVIELVRIRLADDEPIMLETAYLPEDRFPGLASADLVNRSLYQILQEMYHMTVFALDQTLQPVLLTSQQANLLNAQPGVPAMLTKLSVYAQGDPKPIEYSWSVTRGDKCKFYFRFREEGVNSN